MTAEHAIRWEFDRDSVSATAVCYAAPGADCRLTSVIAETPIRPVWLDDGCDWERA